MPFVVAIANQNSQQALPASANPIEEKPNIVGRKDIAGVTYEE